MTKATTTKRLGEIETKLTPKEWAIMLADEVRKYPTFDDAIKAELKTTPDKAITQQKPFRALMAQAEERHPGKKPEDMAAYNQLSGKLWTDFTTLRTVIFSINIDVSRSLEIYGLKAALKMSTLQTLVLQDAFGRTAKKAALWVEEYKTADKDEEENRQIMLKELAAYMDVSFAEKAADSLPLGAGLRMRFPTPIEEWVKDIIELIVNVYSRMAAVQIIQDKYFDGHAILAHDVEAELEGTLKMIEDGAVTFNEYLKTRETLFKVEWDEEDQEDGIASAIPGEREGQLFINLEAIKQRAKGRQVKALAEYWIKESKEKTLEAALMAKDMMDLKDKLVKKGMWNQFWFDGFKQFCALTTSPDDYAGYANYLMNPSTFIPLVAEFLESK